MFSIKLFLPSEKDKSMSESAGVSAVYYATKPEFTQDDQFVHHVFECEDVNGGKYYWPLTQGTRVYVENSAGKTIAHFYGGGPID